MMNKKTITILIACLIVLNGLMIVNAADEGILEEFFNHFKKNEATENTQMSCEGLVEEVRFTVTSENMTELVNDSMDKINNLMEKSNITVNFTDEYGEVIRKYDNISHNGGDDPSNMNYNVLLELPAGTYNYTAYFSGNDLFKPCWLNGTVEIKEEVKKENYTTDNTTNNTTGVYEYDSDDSDEYYSSSSSYSSDSSGYTYTNGTRYYYRYYYVYV